MATATKNENETDAGTETKRKAKSIMVVLPDELRQAVISRASAENKANSRVVAECVAQLFGYELPEPQRSRRVTDGTGLTAKAKNQAITILLEKAQSGEIALSDDLKALLGL